MNRNHGEERWHFDNICYQSGEGLSRVGTKLIIASVLVFVLAIMGEVLIAADNQTKLQNNVSESIDLFKGYDWNDRWGDLSSTGASLTAASNSFILTGHSKNKSYGVIYNDIRINLDDYPEIEIAISDIKGFWFLLVEDQGMPGGYVHLQRDSSSRGVFKYDLKKITGFKRTRNIHLQIGISSGSFSPCDGLFVKIKYLKLNRIHGTKSENTEESGTVSYIPELEKDLRGRFQPTKSI